MKIPQRQEIWENPISQAYVIGKQESFVMYIQKTGNVYKTLEFAEESFVKVFRFKCNAELDVADLFKTENER